jgi:solute carrier family 6 (neurotransmitter transporter)
MSFIKTNCELDLISYVPRLQLGIWVVYFLDTVVGSGWWLALLHCLLLVAVLVVRGRPYNGETLAKSLFGTDTDEEQSEEQATSRTCCGARCGFKFWFAPLLSFVWSVVLPVSLLVSIKLPNILPLL